MKKIYRGWKALQVWTGLGYDPSTDKVIYSDDAWQSFIQVHKECNLLRHKGLCNKELYYNLFEKNHAAGASGFGASIEKRATKLAHHGLEGSFGKRKQRGATDEMTYSAMQEIVSHFCSRSQSGTSNEQSSRPDHLLMCMNIMTEMGIPLNKWTIMWHYFEAHPRVHRTFHQLPDEDRRDIIASVVKSQSPSNN
ncbi:hypothetical protein TIFTF001_027740 [Ficus carica]|uniref:Myb/SANT-like domain-containing protein n=1 Tax=Ficus carica TaxID=3494 RepID=A0AA88J0P0_FICCA|nr:hypothetical protein TIFTF001_027740 [Ficus carica]